MIVSDKDGNPILDLKPEEFSVSEDGQVPEDRAVRRHQDRRARSGARARPTARSARAEDEEREAARPEVRLFIILLDDYHVRRGNDMAVRKPLIDFIQNQLAPADMVAIMYPLTPVNDISFTRNQIAADLGDRARSRGASSITRRATRSKSSTPTTRPRPSRRIRNQITMGALKAAAIRMGGLREGRKSIIFVSEGFTSALPPQLPTRSRRCPGWAIRTAATRGRMTDDRYALDQQRPTCSPTCATCSRRANTQNTSIYSVDPRGLAVFEYGINEGVGLQQDTIGLKSSLDSLHVLSNNTDGRAIVNRNDLAAGMKQIMRDSSGYYLLGYTSARMPTDGKFHEIKVQVSRRGVNVRARKGYWALTKEDVARVSAPPKPEAPAAVTKALTSLAEPPGGRPARFWIGTGAR